MKRKACKNPVEVRAHTRRCPHTGKYIRGMAIGKRGAAGLTAAEIAAAKKRAPKRPAKKAAAKTTSRRKNVTAKRPAKKTDSGFRLFGDW